MSDSPVVRVRYGPLANAFYWFIRGAVRGLAALVLRLRIDGRDQVPDVGSFIVAPTHRSNLDGFLMTVVTRRRMRFMAKESLWSNKLSGWFFRTMGGFPVKRDRADRAALRVCGEVIEMGEPLLVFPEGQRRSGPVVEDLFAGPAYLAHRYGIPIVPVALGGTESAMPVGAKYIRPRRADMLIGVPIFVTKAEGRVSRPAIDATTEQLRVTLQELFDEAQRRSGTPNPTS